MAEARTTSRHRASPTAPKPNQRPKVTSVNGDSQGAAAVSRTVADSLRRLRRARHISLDELSALSGVSRAALSQIEGGRTNPTLAVMWKIAVGLGIPFQSLLGKPNGKKTRVLRASDDVSLNSADGRMKSRLLTLAGASHDVDIYELRFSPKGILKSDAHAAETTETVVLLTGALRITTADEVHELKPGDSMVFNADQPHTYENTGTVDARCIDIVAYGDRTT
jgi:transcriptional regulator with XRE-family HTH domain